MHVRDVGLKQADDQSIWDWAKANNYPVITTDADFIALSKRLGWPPRVIHIEHCDFPFRVIEDLLRRSAVRIAAFDKNEQATVLVLRLSASNNVP
jgi:predicted nuclease of predicted toxin-antitoxin system